MVEYTVPVEIRASVLHGIKDLRTEVKKIEAPGPNELQIAVKSTGICGSDLHYYSDYRNGNIQVREPLILGHESAGEVVAIGSNNSGHFKVGDKVALEVGLPCESCELCDSGRYNICEKMQFRSSARSFPHFQGTLQERVNMPAKYCHRLPASATHEQGALAEPLSVAIHANERASLPQGCKVLVMGAGTIGLLVAAVARARGAQAVVIGDVNPDRLHFATANGFAHHSWLSGRVHGESIQEKIAEIKAMVSSMSEQGVPTQYDAVFECTGVEICVQTAIYACKPGAKVLLIGMGTPIQTLPISDAALREVDLIGVFRYANAYPQAIDMLCNEKHANLIKVATHRVRGFDAISSAFALASAPVDDNGNLVVKVLIEF